MDESEFLESVSKTKKTKFNFYIVPFLVLLIAILTAVTLNSQFRLNKTVNENNTLKQQVSSLDAAKSDLAPNTTKQSKLTLNTVKSLDYDQIKLNIYTFSEPQAEGFYIVKQENTSYADWGKEGSYNYSVLLTKHPYYGNGSYADIEGDKLVAVNASTNSIVIFQINDQYKQYKSFSTLKAVRLPENFSGVPHTIECLGDKSCKISAAWHFEGGCSGLFSLDNYTFSDIYCGEGFEEAR